MNYRHAYHAGNFADVLKHAVLTRVIMYLTVKPQPFRVIDTHAGAGCYDLSGIEAGKTGEWRDGIGRLLETRLPAAAQDLLTPYLDIVRACNETSALTVYPGSPVIARHLMRPVDQLIANELHADDFALLKREFSRTKNAKVLDIDAWQAVKALLPPIERRGVVLIDPPFESREEFSALQVGLREGLKRFATGIFIVWYPVKDASAADRFVDEATADLAGKFLDARVSISTPFPGLGLTETGVLVINPPYTLRAELKVLLPVLCEILAEGQGAGWRLLGGHA